MTLYDSITETIGETPLVRLNRMSPPGTHVYVKIERGNPAGSIKDRAALSMINDAVARGVLEEGGTIIETMSKERISLMKAYGAEVVLSPGAQGMQGAVDTAERIRAERGGFIAGQFDNPANIAAHRVGTGKEILRDLPDVDYIYAGIGTGGTASGIGLACRDCGSKAKVVGIEPAESPLITQGRSGSHNIQGIGSNFVPGNYLPEAVDSVETVPTEDAIATAVELARKEGIFAGISSGANVFAAIRKAREEPSARIVAILPDGGEKYMSLGIYE